MKFESNTNSMFETKPGYNILHTPPKYTSSTEVMSKNKKYCNNNNSINIICHSLVSWSGTITQILEIGRLKFPDIVFTKTERTNPLESAKLFIIRPRGH